MQTNKIIELLIEDMNSKLSGKYELNYEGFVLSLKKNNDVYCLYVSSNVHEVFDYLLAIDSFIDGLNKLNERDE